MFCLMLQWRRMESHGYAWKRMDGCEHSHVAWPDALL
jgi:hypothetical protein